MAAKLQCEICGGKLIGRPGGIYECDSCGMEYDTAWAKAKIQEITGTVKVEGTVEVTGKVQVENGGPSAESLVKRGFLLVDDADWKKAITTFDQALNIDPTDARAYMGKAIAESNVEYVDGVGKEFINPKLDSYRRAFEYGDAKTRAELRYCAHNWAIWKANHRENSMGDEAALAALEPFRDYEDAERLYQIIQNNSDNEKTALDVERNLYRPFLNKIAIGYGVAYAVNIDGTVICFYDSQPKQLPGIEGVKEVYCSGDVLYCLHDDGSVSSRISERASLEEKNRIQKSGEVDVANWSSIIRLSLFGRTVVGLRADGKVVATGEKSTSLSYIDTWENIVDIAITDKGAFGLTRSGKVLDSDVANLLDNENEGDLKEKADIRSWTDIVQLFPTYSYLFALRRNGTIVSTDKCNHYHFRWINMNNIICLCGSEYNIIALTDKMVNFRIAANDYPTGELFGLNLSNDSGKRLLSIKGNGAFSIGLYEDGTLSFGGQIDSQMKQSWKQFRVFSSAKNYEEDHIRHVREKREAEEALRIAKEKKIEEERYMEEQQRKKMLSALKTEQEDLKRQLQTVKGLFAGSKKAKIEARLEEIEAELKKLE